VGDLWARWEGPGRDVALAGVFALCWFGGMAWALRHGWLPASTGGYLYAGGGATLALALGPSFPRVVFVAMAVGYPMLHFQLVGAASEGSEFQLLPLFVAAYRVAVAGALPSIWILPTCWVAVVVVFQAWTPLLDGIRVGGPGQDWLLSSWPLSFSQFLFQLLLVTTCVLLGRAQFRQHRAARQLELRNAELERLRRVEAMQVVSAERTRIARELHDVVAHHMSAVVIRAQAADRVADARPDEPRQAVRWIAATGQDALAAMRHVVRVLRTPEPEAPTTPVPVQAPGRARPATAGAATPPATAAATASATAAYAVTGAVLGSALGPATSPIPLAPQPSLGELPDLTARVSGAGVPVGLDVAPLPPLPPQVELAALRIVQESLTNVLLHAGAARAAVRIGIEGGSLRVDVDDDGPAGPPKQDPFATDASWIPASGGGNGLPGMRERALSCGGGVRVGASPLGGWRVTALLPAAPAGSAPTAATVGA
jgi:signal transduction histidine kinase